MQAYSFSKIIVVIVLFIVQLTLNSCSSEPTAPPINPGVNILNPSNGFVKKEFESLFIQIIVESDKRITSVELYAHDSYGNFDSVDAKVIFDRAPYETYLNLPEICVENDSLSLFAKAYFEDGGSIRSSLVSGFIIKRIPHDSLLTHFNYLGFDLDSNLVVEGLLTLQMIVDSTNNVIHLRGRRYLNAIDEKLAYEKGEGYTEGSFGLNNFSYLGLTHCDYVIYNGMIMKVDLLGTYSDGVIMGERLLVSTDPQSIHVGYFIAV